ncbi:hypothetical protein MHYP_G00353050 [Metynnis hypsauchen]
MWDLQKPIFFYEGHRHRAAIRLRSVRACPRWHPGLCSPPLSQDFGDINKLPTYGVCINYEESLVLEAALTFQGQTGCPQLHSWRPGGCPGQRSGSRTPAGEKSRRARSENVSVCGEKQLERQSEEAGGARRSRAFGSTHAHTLAGGELRVARLTQIIPSQLCQATEEAEIMASPASPSTPMPLWQEVAQRFNKRRQVVKEKPAKEKTVKETLV